MPDDPPPLIKGLGNGTGTDNPRPSPLPAQTHSEAMKMSPAEFNAACTEAALAERKRIVEALRQEAEGLRYGTYAHSHAAPVLRAFADRLEATGTTSEGE